ncbi:hypothetical protein ACWX0P_29270 [Vibrio mediterranei]
MTLNKATNSSNSRLEGVVHRIHKKHLARERTAIMKRIQALLSEFGLIILVGRSLSVK